MVLCFAFFASIAVTAFNICVTWAVVQSSNGGHRLRKIQVLGPVPPLKNLGKKTSVIYRQKEAQSTHFIELIEFTERSKRECL